MKNNRYDRQCKSKYRGSAPFHLWSKRMGAFIDKVIIVLKVLIALLELIRTFFA
ncbi:MULTISPECIES: damage-inducible type I toxin DinQ [Photorhabdus]|uniref:Damage-inducible type I toxin DinQ n=1 Tax=Photorhabdus bodei TaxID=2029681 RepID=A0AAW6BQ74_9GAMM|nr:MULTISPECIES: damage-inducible type I toxin DinQ [Photorhabdus]MDB6374766.1 damage-inducible type I toxin DinQ [Photorhabdus bodei]